VNYTIRDLRKHFGGLVIPDRPITDFQLARQYRDGLRDSVARGERAVLDRGQPIPVEVLDELCGYTPTPERIPAPAAPDARIGIVAEEDRAAYAARLEAWKKGADWRNTVPAAVAKLEPQRNAEIDRSNARAELTKLGFPQLPGDSQ
jgi:hypothetical protein